jgi:hypothetical protein
MEQLFTDDELKDAVYFKSYTFSSSYIQNNGNGKFTIKPLPVAAQFAPVFGLSVADFNYDGNLDLLLVGNSYATETAMGYYDAGIGTCLLGTGKGTFRVVPPKKSGFKVTGDAKAMARLVTANKVPLEIITCNNDSLQVYKSQKTPPELRIIRVAATDAYADLIFANGKKQREEIYYGAGYLSQSSRAIVATGLAQVFITDFAGKKRQIKL